MLPDGVTHLAWLAGDLGDEVEVAVVVEQGETGLFGGGGDEQIGDLASPLAAGGEEALDLAGPLDMGGGIHPVARDAQGRAVRPAGRSGEPGLVDACPARRACPPGPLAARPDPRG